MYVTMHSYEIGRGTQIDLARIAQGFLETVSAVPGFRAYYMIDGGDHRIGSVSLFDTPEGVEECDRLATKFVQDQLGGFQLSDVETTEGKVLASLQARRPDDHPLPSP